MATSASPTAFPHTPHSPHLYHSTTPTTSADSVSHPHPQPSSASQTLSSAHRAATPLEDEAPDISFRQVNLPSDKLSNKRPRLTDPQEDPDYNHEHPLSDQDSYLPNLSLPSTVFHHISIPPSTSISLSVPDSPQLASGPPTSLNFGLQQSQTSSVSSSGLERQQDSPESDSQSSSVEQLESVLLTGTESDLEESSGSDGVAITKSDSEGNVNSDWDTDSEGQSLTKKEVNMSVSAVRDLLERNGLFINDAEAAVRGAALIDKAKEIMDQRRHSSMEDDEAMDIKETMEYYSTINEKTMLVNLWQLLVNKTRFVKKVREDGSQEQLTAEEEEAAAEWIERAWRKDDHLIGKYDADFRAETIPEISKSGDPVLDTLLEQVPRVDKPKPDIAMGFHKKRFSRRVLEILEKYAPTLTSGQYMTLHATEAKAVDGTMGMALTQCSRVGSAMSMNFLNFWNATEEFLKDQVPAQASTYPKPNKKSMSFTLALTPDMAKMNVHWAMETGPGAQTWHQTELRTYRMDVLEDIRELRRNLDNIFDWGCGPNMKKIVEQAERVAARRAQMSSPQRKVKDKEVKDLLESPSIKRRKKKQQASEE
ncbi:MAG: hypothetical protein LQ345_001018 [Seirophora villosa]|nr:MAG: hypothetical protein LQ345_001018 [Seirophora villosa]